MASQSDQRINVAVTDAHREVKRGPPVMASDHADDVTESDSVAPVNRPSRQIRVGGPQSSMVDRDCPVPHDHSAERDIPVAGCTNRCLGGSGDVDAPVSAVPACRKEFADNVTGYRPRQRRAGRRSD
jgi:hypothetical protein